MAEDGEMPTGSLSLKESFNRWYSGVFPHPASSLGKSVFTADLICKILSSFFPHQKEKTRGLSHWRWTGETQVIIKPWHCGAMTSRSHGSQGSEYGVFCRMSWRDRPLLGKHVIFEHLLERPWGGSSHGCQLGAYQPLWMKLNYFCMSQYQRWGKSSSAPDFY